MLRVHALFVCRGGEDYTAFVIIRSTTTGTTTTTR